jgi:uroporphyrinogen-III decarboxylase
VDRRELIKSVLNGRRAQRLPRALFGGGRWFWKQTGQIPEDVETDPTRFAEKLASLYRELDTDIVFAGSGMNSFPAEAIGGELAFKEGQAPLLAHPIIEKTEDARYLDHVDIGLSPHSLALIAMIAHLRKLLPDRYLCVTSWGPFTWGMILCEWNMLQERTTRDPEFIREVCSLGVRLSLALFKPLIEMGSVDGVVIADGAATLVPLDLYRRNDASLNRSSPASAGFSTSAGQSRLSSLCIPIQELTASHSMRGSVWWTRISFTARVP